MFRHSCVKARSLRVMYPRSNWNLEVLVFVEGQENWIRSQRKTLRGRARANNKVIYNQQESTVQNEQPVCEKSQRKTFCLFFSSLDLFTGMDCDNCYTISLSMMAAKEQLKIYDKISKSSVFQ